MPATVRVFRLIAETKMSWFRRAVIGIAEVVQIVVMIGMTLIGGFAGIFRSIVFELTQRFDADGIDYRSNGNWGLVLGASVAFVVSTTVAALIFTLAQIEVNTRANRR